MPASSDIIVVDDFLTEPQSLRDMALQLTYPEDQHGAFAGRNSEGRIELDGLLQEASRCVGEPLQLVMPPESHTKCRVTLAGERGRAGVGFNLKTTWSGVLFLSRPEDCCGGMDFFRHRRTNTEHAPLDQGQLQAMGYATSAAMYEDIVVKDGTDPTKWAVVERVPVRYNRAVFFHSWMWHCASDGFGDRIENGRLMYLMFFGAAPAPAKP